jgi:hypothetical protein
MYRIYIIYIHIMTGINGPFLAIQQKPVCQHMMVDLDESDHNLMWRGRWND